MACETATITLTGSRKTSGTRRAASSSRPDAPHPRAQAVTAPDPRIVAVPLARGTLPSARREALHRRERERPVEQRGHDERQPDRAGDERVLEQQEPRITLDERQRQADAEDHEHDDGEQIEPPVADGGPDDPQPRGEGGRQERDPVGSAEEVQGVVRDQRQADVPGQPTDHQPRGEMALASAPGSRSSGASCGVRTSGRCWSRGVPHRPALCVIHRLFPVGQLLVRDPRPVEARRHPARQRHGRHRSPGDVGRVQHQQLRRAAIAPGGDREQPAVVLRTAGRGTRDEHGLAGDGLRPDGVLGDRARRRVELDDAGGVAGVGDRVPVARVAADALVVHGRELDGPVRQRRLRHGTGRRIEHPAVQARGAGGGRGRGVPGRVVAQVVPHRHGVGGGVAGGVEDDPARVVGVGVADVEDVAGSTSNQRASPGRSSGITPSRAP